VPRGRAGLCLLAGAVAHASVASAQPSAVPTLDCGLGYDQLHATINALPGVQPGQRESLDVVTLSAPEEWSIEVAFTAPGHSAHPAVTIRTFRKQPTGVWTAESKGCGYGDPGQFKAMMAGMKAVDTQLSNASRDAVEREKREKSPLAPP